MGFKINYKQYVAVISFLASLICLLYGGFVSSEPRFIRLAFGAVFVTGMMVWYFFNDKHFFKSMIIVFLVIFTGAFIFVSGILSFLDPFVESCVFLVYFLVMCFIIVYVMLSYLDKYA